MLPDLRGDDGLAPGQVMNLLDYVLRLDHILGRFIVQGMLCRVLTDLLQPGFPGSLPHIPLLLEKFDHSGQNVFGVPHYGNVHGHILADR